MIVDLGEEAKIEVRTPVRRLVGGWIFRISWQQGQQNFPMDGKWGV